VGGGALKAGADTHAGVCRVRFMAKDDSKAKTVVACELDDRTGLRVHAGLQSRGVGGARRAVFCSHARHARNT